MDANIRRRCLICREWFLPHPAVKNKNSNRQKTCSKKHCQRERHRLGCLEWHKKNPKADSHRRDKMRAWAKKSDYWRKWRGKHLTYCHREVARMRAKRRQARNVAKRDEQSQMTLDKLKSIQTLRPKTVAKRDELDPRIDSLLEFLFWKEGVAKRDDLDLASVSGR